MTCMTSHETSPNLARTSSWVQGKDEKQYVVVKDSDVLAVLS